MYPNKRYTRRPKPKKLASPKALFVVVFLLFALIAGGGFLAMRHQNSATSSATKNPPPAPTFDKKLYSLTDPTSQWVVVDKLRPLNPKQYQPTTLRTPNIKVESGDMQVNDLTATGLEEMASAAATEGINLMVVSAYRSYTEQVTIYNSMVRGYGQAEADRQSARPGYSEHQSGWAVDLGAASGKCRIDPCFADTPEGKWLATNAYKYGFIIRYPSDKEQITGYNYEPWHVRFVGKELSTEMHRTGTQTLEEFFNLPAAANY